MTHLPLSRREFALYLRDIEGILQELEEAADFIQSKVTSWKGAPGGDQYGYDLVNLARSLRGVHEATSDWPRMEMRGKLAITGALALVADKEET